MLPLSPILRELLPYLVSTALAAVAVMLLLWRLLPPPAPALVTFDVIKYMNAQRQVASAFLGANGRGHAESAALLLDVSRRTRAVIEEVAGPGTAVLVKQGVVSGHSRDITDEVLRRLGLPTEVPTQDAAGALLDEAPTQMLLRPAPPPPPAPPTPPGAPARPSLLP